MNAAALALALTLAIWLAPSSPAGAAAIDFESLADLESVTTQFPGLTFSNATVLTAGITLNEFEFPPKSGVNVVFDNGGAIVIDFAAPVASVQGFFTYLTPLTFTAFDAAFNPIDVDTSDFSSNLALSGDPGSSPNELLHVESGAGIAHVKIAGDPFGGSFTLDDFAVPMPGTLTLVVFGIAGALGWRRVRRRKIAGHE